jgi:hypothetical protein
MAIEQDDPPCAKPLGRQNAAQADRAAADDGDLPHAEEGSVPTWPCSTLMLVSRDLDPMRSIRLPDKKTRHSSLMRMLCSPLRSTINATNGLRGGMRRVANSPVARI